MIQLVLALDDDLPLPRRRRDDDAWGGCMIVLMVILSLGIPLLGIILGIMDMGSNSPKKRQQGMAFIAVGLVSMLVYGLALAY